jgi:uncharacterized protein YndB with AHSA1/START domain
MPEPIIHEADPNLDLLLERVIDVPRELVWKAWTMPEHIKKWFTPAPWKTIDCEVDLRPGGIFRTVMQSPERQTFPNIGCYLEIVDNSRLVWTNAMQPGYRPSAVAQGCPGESFYFTGILTFERHGAGTKYTALVKHAEAAAKKRHAEMGFYDGWNSALNQLIEVAKTM